jgi:hypothetical protein
MSAPPVKMSPFSFSFKLTIPNDPDGATIAAGVAAHAAEYAKLPEADRAAFVERVREFAGKALTAGTAHACLMVFAAANGQLTVTAGKDSISQPLPA